MFPKVEQSLRISPATPSISWRIASAVPRLFIYAKANLESKISIAEKKMMAKNPAVI
jgi:hypothetical protein